MKGTWKTPITRDPLDVPIEEKVALLLAANEAALKVPKVRFVNSGLQLLREEKTLATTEGTLVASYSRGMKVLNQSGGVTATVVADAMQRAPVFVFVASGSISHFAPRTKQTTSVRSQMWRVETRRPSRLQTRTRPPPLPILFSVSSLRIR